MATFHQITVHSIERMRNSKEGNPRYKIFSDGGFNEWKTAANSSCAYEITEGLVGESIKVRTNYAGHVIEIER